MKKIASSHLRDDNFIVSNYLDHSFKEFFVDLKEKLALHFYAKAVDTIWTRLKSLKLF